MSETLGGGSYTVSSPDTGWQCSAAALCSAHLWSLPVTQQNVSSMAQLSLGRPVFWCCGLERTLGSPGRARVACLPSAPLLCPLLVGAREPELRCREAQSSWFPNNVQPVWFSGLEPVPGGRQELPAVGSRHAGAAPVCAGRASCRGALLCVKTESEATMDAWRTS